MDEQTIVWEGRREDVVFEDIKYERNTMCDDNRKGCEECISNSKMVEQKQTNENKDLAF